MTLRRDEVPKTGHAELLGRVRAFAAESQGLGTRKLTC